MTNKSALRSLFKVIEDEADNNPEFAERLHAALRALAISVHQDLALKPAPRARKASGNARTKTKREPAALDPVKLARQGEATLREGLAALSVQQLKDIIAEFGMDTANQTKRWSKIDRLIGHIVPLAMSRSTKGDAFL